MAVCIFVIKFVLQVFVFSHVETKNHRVIKSEFTCDSYLCLNLISNKAVYTCNLFFTAISFDFQFYAPGGDLFHLKLFPIMLSVGSLVSCSLQAVTDPEVSLWPLTIDG